ncbi:MAG: sialate O-acetylesterase [Oscillospiraceae bacterium]|nr:sialate O-acetylesterase [Oscillospiraceae bacterium]
MILRAAAVFSDNMVLQMGKPVKVWGHGMNGRTVSVSVCGRTASCECRDNRWTVVLPPVTEYGGPYDMTVSDGTERVVFTNIMIGEVWIAGGQSNMELELQNEKHGAEELKNLCKDIRFYYTKKNAYIDEYFYLDERNGGWAMPDEESARCWSAVGYYFAKRLAHDLNVTVGIIGCNWGGTSASNWVDKRSLAKHTDLDSYNREYDAAMEGKTEEEYLSELKEYNDYNARWQPLINEFYANNPHGSWEEAQAYAGPARYPEPLGPRSPFRPGGLYETMLRRIAPYTARGFIYYQGESDDHKPQMYEALLTLLIDEWRTLWGDEDMPFINVQLPMHRWKDDEDTKNWCIIRQAQMNVYRKVRNTGLAVALDCGEFDNIHPVDKTKVGERLALQALYMVYERLSSDEACAPVIKEGYPDGDAFVIKTVHADTWLINGDTDGFELAGDDGVYHRARAEFSQNRILLYADEVTAPVTARYKWTNYADVWIFGGNGLPLAPFSTSVI